MLDADTKQEYGTVTDVTHPAASDVYEVRNEQGEVFLFPAVKEFLGELKPEEGFITVRPIAGMFTSCLLYTSQWTYSPVRSGHWGETAFRAVRGWRKGQWRNNPGR